ncbi:MAG: DoxX family protein [Frankiales bacterium]|nr:DoxX family protein [Frankiales bacterium]
MAEGLFFLRLFLGVLLFAHGTQKLFGWFGGHGPDATGGFFEQVGHRPGRQMAILAGLSEAGGGTLLVLGLINPLACAIIIGVMVTAAVSVHGDKGLWATNGGYELPLTNAVIAGALAFTGAGSFSFDNAIGLNLSGWLWGIAAVVVGLIGAGVQLARRETAVDTEDTADAYPAETGVGSEQVDVPADPASPGKSRRV